VKILNSYLQIVHDGKSYWRREDGRWCVLKKAFGFQALAKNRSDELESVYQEWLKQREIDGEEN